MPFEEVSSSRENGCIPDAAIENGILKVDRLTGAVPDGAGAMVLDLYGRLPTVRITDLLQEVDTISDLPKPSPICAPAFPIGIASGC